MRDRQPTIRIIDVTSLPSQGRRFFLKILSTIYVPMTSLLTGAARGEEKGTNTQLPSAEDRQIINIDPQVNDALGRIRMFPGSRKLQAHRFITMLSVDCIWCRYQYISNLKYVHLFDIRYVLTSFDEKFEYLIDPALLGTWQTTPSKTDLENFLMVRMLFGVDNKENIERSSYAKKFISEQVNNVGNLFSILRKKFALNEIEITGYPCSMLINPAATKLAVISQGYNPYIYYKYIEFLKGTDFRAEGLKKLKAYVADAPRNTDCEVGEVSGRAASAIHQCFSVAPTNLIAGDFPKIYIFFDPAQFASRALWVQMLSAALYTNYSWIPVADFDDQQSLTSWMYLYRTMESKTSSDSIYEKNEHTLHSVMLGYEPINKNLKPTEVEVELMMKAKITCDRLILVTKTFPFVMWHNQSGNMGWAANPDLLTIYDIARSAK